MMNFVCVFFLSSSILYLVYLHLLLSRATLHPVSSLIGMASQRERWTRPWQASYCVFFGLFIFIVEFWKWSQVAYLSYVMIIERKIQIVIGIGIGIDAYWMFISN